MALQLTAGQLNSMFCGEADRTGVAVSLSAFDGITGYVTDSRWWMDWRLRSSHSRRHPGFIHRYQMISVNTLARDPFMS